MSDRDRWIVVPNWKEFQHYKDRVPVWIKLHLELNSKPEWRHLTYAERGLLTTIWVEFARSKGTLEVTSLSGLGSLKGMTNPLKRLSDAGFIELRASKPLALTRSKRPYGLKKRSRRASTQEENRPNAAAYSSPGDNGDPGDYVSFEQLQAYAAALDNRHSDA